ncbi:hypothetical protein BKA65DRAFT_511119 [Rhexocercosporidium sp. MPI-PUGE-AT-0058]|nr:hypothetical protein BKA65DRAFT_511119 [Rhexocercosporidium sp. MPI-PUGE-AT-0058]
MQISFFTLLALATSALACSHGQDCCWADLAACQNENVDDVSTCLTRESVFAQCENLGFECVSSELLSWIGSSRRNFH